MNVFIRQLTGVRFVAAAWVLAYHLQVPLNTLGVLGIPVLADFLRVGRLGVDLFFALSGFILAHTYLERMGPSLKAKASGFFLWLRLARIYPVHIVMMVVAGLAVVAQAKVTGEALDRDWLNPWDFLKNVLLIQEWGPAPQRGWNFVSWSLSMEWLAYLCFPFIVLVLWRFRRSLPTWGIAVAWVVVLVPLVIYGLSTTDSYYTDNWGSTIRVLTEFIAGGLTYLIVTRAHPGLKGDPTPKVERIATILTIVLPILVVIGAVILANMPAAQPPQMTIGEDAEPVPPYFHLLLVPLLIAWIGALALSRRGLTRTLATQTLVLGGFISYSLYMTHLVWFGMWRAGMKAAGISGGALYAVGVIGLVVGALLIAWLMWKFIEEPAREWMRKLIGTRPKPTEEAG
ncbi:MAG: acyltransferase, partial [Candidatus Nanopelagicales bacterium]|nr:acyltransferase [Candidatus Nanopelagicales bacterium]